VGGWDGIVFNNASGYNGATSSLKHCVIEKSGMHNIHCWYTKQPRIDYCTIQNAVNYGLYCFSPNDVPWVSNTTFSGNQIDGIVVNGGTISSDVTWPYFGGDYIVLGDVLVDHGTNFPRLTIMPGNTIKFGVGAQLIIGDTNDDEGELYAEGTADSVITFTALGDTVGGWDGIVFNTASG
ncbi:MAG: right-handed parallel beta-helix repeat-containing protein, partial [Planctomycetes bacterium]|nr:right-handed parallel beta-helix repeat-containing protein [Planctomycetota bacterium]